MLVIIVGGVFKLWGLLLKNLRPFLLQYLPVVVKEITNVLIGW